MIELRLTATEVEDMTRWSWRLDDPDLQSVGYHRVALDASDTEFEAWIDLPAFLARFRDPADPWRTEQELLARVGGWIASNVLGELAGTIVEAADRSPVVVRVAVPKEADFLLYRPMEIAQVGDVCLATSDVSFVLESEVRRRPRGTEPARDSLRVLAVFSTPVDETALALRRERHALARLMRDIASGGNRRIEFHALQYGATTEQLEEALEDGRGWDIVHFSGHGLPAGLVFEQPDGTSEMVPSTRISELLRTTRETLKLVTLSSCDSGAVTAHELLASLGVESAAPTNSTASSSPDELPAVAKQIIDTIDCAVLAMRFSVDDAFAVALGHVLYRGLLAKSQSLPRALQLALRRTLETDNVPYAPLSVGTPALFGPRAVDLRFDVPAGSPQEFVEQTPGLSTFPAEPERFVGRVRELVATTRQLSERGTALGVLFWGMAGAGKTACALELAYRHATNRFEAMVWHRAPREGESTETSFTDFLTALDLGLPGVGLAGTSTSEQILARALQSFKQVLEERAILIVLDNMESLLADDRSWKDPRWAVMFEALLGHGGRSRVILTSRYQPSGIVANASLHVERIDSLSLQESILLARQMPNLGPLISQNTNGRGMRSRAVRILTLVQGNPELLRLADRQAADPDILELQLDAADRAWLEGNGELSSFLQAGRSDFDAEHFLRVLERWTQTIVEALPPEGRLMFQVLCLLENNDRASGLVDIVWKPIWSDIRGDTRAPDARELLESLVRSGLLDVTDPLSDQTRFTIHPAVAHVGQLSAADELPSVVAVVLARLWVPATVQALDAFDAPAATQAARHGAPYLLRRRDWETLTAMLRILIVKDPSPRAAAFALPLVERCIEGLPEEDIATRLTAKGIRAACRAHTDPEASISELAQYVDEAAASQEYETASELLTELVPLLRDSGRLHEALAAAERRAGFGEHIEGSDWWKLSLRVQVVQLKQAMGHDEETLQDTLELLDQADSLDVPSVDSGVPPYNVIEATLNTANRAATALGKHELAIELNARAVASKRARGAREFEVATTEFNDYGDLVTLGRLDEAEALLRRCQPVFEGAQAVHALGRLWTAWAHLYSARDKPRESIEFGERGLRYMYDSGEVAEIARTHHNLGVSLMSEEVGPTAALNHFLASALLRAVSGSPGLENDLGVAVSLCVKTPGLVVPATAADLDARIRAAFAVDLAAACARVLGSADKAEEPYEYLKEAVQRAVAEQTRSEDTA